jgi:hypothetical protein
MYSFVQGSFFAKASNDIFRVSEVFIFIWGHSSLKLRMTFFAERSIYFYLGSFFAKASNDIFRVSEKWYPR